MAEPLVPEDPVEVGKYRLLERLGEGGMGQVFLGITAGGRRVAVKVIAPKYASDPEFRARFAREVAAARRVGGFHTAQVVDADTDATAPWMASAYIPGPSLRAAVTADGPMSPKEVLALGAALAEGLAAIHSCGLIHRDLKPGNIILASDGPRIIDFGIVRAVDAHTTLTETGTAIGTVPFMSPEQVTGKPAGPASDVFSLGSVLSYAATGHGPFDASEMAVTMYRVRFEAPNLGAVDGPLRAMLSDCLAKDPGARPALDDLLHRLASLAVTESVPGAAAAACAADDRTGESADETHEKTAAADQQQRTERPGDEIPTEFRLTAADTARHLLALRSPKPQSTVAAHARDIPGVQTDRGRHDSPVEDQGQLTPQAFITGSSNSGYLPTARGTIYSGRPVLDENPVGHISPSVFKRRYSRGWLASNGFNGTVVVRNLGAGKESVLAGKNNCSGSPTFRPGDGDVLATSCWDGTVRLWHAVTGEQLAVLKRAFTGTGDEVVGSACVSNLEFSKDGTILATGCLDKKVRLWDVTRPWYTVKSLSTLKAKGKVHSFSFSPDGKTLALAVNGLELWNVASGRRVAILDRVRGGSTCSLGNRTLACIRQDGVGLWDIATGAHIGTLAVQSPLWTIYSSDGTTLAIVRDNEVQFWNTVTCKHTGTVVGHTQRVKAADFSPSGRLLATGSNDNTVRLWNVTTCELVDILPVKGSARVVAFNTNGGILAAVSAEVMRRWDISDLEGYSIPWALPRL